MSGGTHPSLQSIREGQLEDLRSLVTELLPANDFYSRKLSARGVTFDVASLEDFSKRFPFTTKAELIADQQRCPPYGTNLTFPLDRYNRFHQTSGTSGSPLRWLDTPESWQWMVESWMEIFQVSGVTGSDRIYFAFSFGPFIGFWLGFEAGTRLGALCIPGGGLSSTARLKAILDNQATVLCCTPTYALRLAEVAAQEGIDLSKSGVKRIFAAGEPGASIPATRARLESQWPGAKVIDHHGMTETGPVTFECPARPGTLHVIESAYFPEVIHRETGEPVPPGSTGELILTTLGRMGSPVLRYRTGDIVKTADQPVCVCGRSTLALEGGILGRTDDMFLVRGVNVFPGVIEEIILSWPGVVEYQVNVNTSGALVELRVQVETTSAGAEAMSWVAGLEKLFYDRLHLRIPVQAVPSGTLPRFEMKARRWVRSG